jgi:hypothetical protein
MLCREEIFHRFLRRRIRRAAAHEEGGATTHGGGASLGAASVDVSGIAHKQYGFRPTARLFPRFVTFQCFAGRKISLRFRRATNSPVSARDEAARRRPPSALRSGREFASAQNGSEEPNSRECNISTAICRTQRPGGLRRAIRAAGNSFVSFFATRPRQSQVAPPGARRDFSLTPGAFVGRGLQHDRPSRFPGAERDDLGLYHNLPF